MKKMLWRSRGLEGHILLLLLLVLLIKCFLSSFLTGDSLPKLFVHYAVLLFRLMDFEVYGVSFLTKTQEGKNKTIWSLCFV